MTINTVSSFVSEIKSTFGSVQTLVRDFEFARTRVGKYIQSLQESSNPFLVQDDLDQAFVEVLEMLPSAADWKKCIQYTDQMSHRVAVVKAESYHFQKVFPLFDEPEFTPPLGFCDVSMAADPCPVFLHPGYQLILEADYRDTSKRQVTETGSTKERYRVFTADAQRRFIMSTNSFSVLCGFLDALERKAPIGLELASLAGWMKYQVHQATGSREVTSVSAALKAVPGLLECAQDAGNDFTAIHVAAQQLSSWLTAKSSASRAIVLGARGMVH